MRLRTRFSYAAATALLLGLAGLARGDEQDRACDAQIFQPALDGNGVFTANAAQVPVGWSIRATMNLTGQPMALRLGTQGAETVPVLDYGLSLDLQAFYGLNRWVGFGLSTRLVHQWLGAGFDPDEPLGFLANEPASNMVRWYDGTSAGDIRLSVKANFLHWRGLGLGFALTGVVPSGDEAIFAGEKGLAGEGSLLVSYVRGRFTVAANAGYVLRPEERILNPVAQGGSRQVLLEIDDEFTWALGAKVRFVSRLALGLEAYGRVPLLAQGPSDLPLELLGGLFVRATEHLHIVAGGGAGLGRYVERSGLKPLGRTPKWRFFASIGYLPQPSRAHAIAQRDTDGDGVPDSLDTCPREPEDQDGYQDADGCPDDDNDGDGLPDSLDKCPNQTEDQDGYQDADGCPDDDNDGDGIPDLKDRCPNRPEDRDGYQDTDGCPDDDNDGDGILDAKDQCPDEPGSAANNGCPSPVIGPMVVGSRIRVSEKIYFERGKAVLKLKSKRVLDKVAQLLMRNPQIRLVRIEGHTDSRGSPRRNLVLSQRRAEAVMRYLISKGVSPNRLQAVGYGDTRPIAPNDTAAGRAKNRRVEFIIVRQ